MQQRLPAAVRGVAGRLAHRSPVPTVKDLAGLPSGEVIVVLLVGGLGNQMFQYAAARALALRASATLVLDLSWFRTQSKQRFGLDEFAIDAVVLDEAAGNSATRRLPVLKERGFHFQPELVAGGVNCYLEGYWQSERYFADAREQIRADFLMPYLATPAGIAESERAVSVHVRRGDYVSEPETLAYHGTCSLEYYARAMDLLRRLVPGARFRVFSDDPGWAQDNLAGSDVNVISEPGSSPHADLSLMAQCRHHVLANSSFSWWGAWLSPAGGTTVAPRPWFLTPDNNTTDLLPPAWLTLG